MMKLTTRAMLASAMGFAWDMIKTGERISEATTSWGDDQHAGPAEKAVHKLGRVIAGTGERLERGVNRLAMRLGYDDGEASGMVA